MPVSSNLFVHDIFEVGKSISGRYWQITKDLYFFDKGYLQRFRKQRKQKVIKHGYAPGFSSETYRIPFKSVMGRLITALQRENGGDIYVCEKKTLLTSEKSDRKNTLFLALWKAFN